MRIPKDKPLRQYILELIARDEVEEFYLTDDWRELRKDVMDELHNECQECLKKGKYTKANCVHHVNEVRVLPDLALSKYYVDRHGQKQRNLLPLCNTCHNLIHNKLGQYVQQNKFTNKERW